MFSKVKDILLLIKKITYILSKRKKKQAIYVFMSMIACSLLELLGVSIIFPFLQVLLDSNDSEKAQSVLFWAYKFGITDKNHIIVIIAVFFAMVYLLKNGLMMFCLYIQNRYATDFNRETSTKILDAYLQKPYIFFVNNNSSVILRAVENDVEGAYQVLINMLNALNECISILMIGIILLITDWSMALLTLVLASASLLAIVLGFKPTIKRAGIVYREAAADKKKYSYQAVNGIKEILILGRRNQFVEQYENVAVKEAKAKTVYGYLSAWPDRILEGVCIGGFMLIVAIRIVTNGNPETFIPVLGLFAMGAFKILPSFSKISSRINSVIYYSPSLNNCYDVIRGLNINREKEEITQQNKKLLLENTEDIQRNCSLISAIEVNDLTWRYGEESSNILQNVSLAVSKGESVALIGPSGGGKTTLADIMMGLLLPQNGTVRLYGSLITSPDDINGRIGYVAQTLFLIDDTIRSNVALGIPREEIDDDKVWNVLKKAQIDGVIKASPDGLDTMIGESGIKLSGGQRQRIAIARALYNDPEILIFDEATSALDNETETAVMDAIEALQGQKTIIIIAHRLSTIRKCNRVFEVKNGKVTEKDKSEIVY